MKTTLTQNILGTIIAIAALVAPGNSAEAAEFKICSGDGYDISGHVSDAQSCTVSNEYNQDYLDTDPITVNVNSGFFDETDWIFGGKIGIDDSYLGDGSGQSGIFDFSDVDTEKWDKVMLVFKHGTGTYITGYLLEDGVTSGTWQTPFEASANGSIYNFSGGSRDVAHISVYYTTSNPAVTAVSFGATPRIMSVASLVLAMIPPVFMMAPQAFLRG